MENDARSKVLLRLLEMANSKGYVTFDDIMSCSDESSLSIKDFDWVAESIVYRNVLVYDTPPVQQYPIDLTQYIPKPSTYDQVYKEIVALDPSLKQLIMDIRSIEPPRRGEITRLQAQIADGNQYARTRMIEMYMRVALKVALGQFTRNYTQTVKRAADNKRRYAPGWVHSTCLLRGFPKGAAPHLAHDFAEQSVVCYTLCRRCPENTVAAGEGKGI